MAAPQEEEKATILHQWFEEIWNQGDLGAIDRLFAPHGVVHRISEVHAEDHADQGRDEFRAFVERFRGAFPDMKVTVHDVITQGDRIAGRWTAEMTHQGDSLGFPATGRRVRISGMSFARIENGQLAEGWNNWDGLSLLQQLGLVPTAP